MTLLFFDSGNCLGLNFVFNRFIRLVPKKMRGFFVFFLAQETETTGSSKTET